MRIAVAGKGGTGKSFIAAALAKLYAMNAANDEYNSYSGQNLPSGLRPSAGINAAKGLVYAVDAEPGGGLGAALGLSQSDIEAVKPICEMRDFIETREDDGALYLTGPGAADADGQFDTVTEGVHYLRMAGVKKAGSGCYCDEYGFLRALLASLALGEKDTLILDMGAGYEHFTRGAIKGTDILLIVSESTRVCIENAKNMRQLGAGLGVRHIYIAANKIRSEREELLIRANFRRGEIIGLIRFSETVANHAIGVGAGSARQTLSPGADMEELFYRLRSVKI